jgi:hypothetical protein
MSLKERAPSSIKAALRPLRNVILGNVFVNTRLISKAPHPLKLHLGSGPKPVTGVSQR